MKFLLALPVPRTIILLEMSLFSIEKKVFHFPGNVQIVATNEGSICVLRENYGIVRVCAIEIIRITTDLVRLNSRRVMRSNDPRKFTVKVVIIKKFIK